MRERYAETIRSAPHVLYGLSESWEPLMHILPHGNGLTSIAFSPDGEHIISGSCDMTVQIWNTLSGVQEGLLEGHMDMVTSVAFSDGSRISSGSWDRTVRIWNAAGSRRLSWKVIRIG
jgi:WD40 repeat protein